MKEQPIPQSTTERHQANIQLDFSRLERVGAPESKNEALIASFLHELSVGFLLLNQDAKVVFLSKALSNIVDLRDGIQLKRDSLVLYNEQEAAAFATIVDQCLNAPLNPKSTSIEKCGILVTRPSGKRSFALTFKVIGDARRTKTPPMGIAVCLNDSAEMVALRAQALAQLYNLSRSETNLLMALTQTGSSPTAAANCGITTGSARQYFKRIFHKTGTSSQTELMGLLGGLMPL